MLPIVLETPSSTTLENAFLEAERAAASSLKTASALNSVLKAAEKAAKTGNIGVWRKSLEKLQLAQTAMQQEIRNLQQAWPLTPEQEDQYLRHRFEEELVETGLREGLSIKRRDDHLVAYPSVIRVIPADRAVRIDRKKVATIRPSHLVGVLKTSQTKKPKFASERFLEALFNAYQVVTGPEGAGRTVKLADIYGAFTLLPGSSAEYDPTAFSRDLFLLDRSGLTQSKAGFRFSLPASTGTKSGKDMFSFVSQEGETVTFYGIQFTKANA